MHPMFPLLLFLILLFTACKPKLVTHTNFSEKVQGIWTDGNSENASFQISKDSIYYVDHFLTFKYEVKKDSIFIHYPDYFYRAGISFSGDTLILHSAEMGRRKYYPFRN
ncbi:MAG: hypothetical protein ACOZCO_01475 [Bacteroidota bacterium]